MQEQELIERELERRGKLLRKLEAVMKRLYRLGALNEFMLG